MSLLDSLLLHQSTKENIERFASSTNHALLMVAPEGAGKKSLLFAVAELLGAARPEQQILVSSDEPSISINQARTLRASLNLRPKKGSAQAVLIPNAEKLTPEAQNALLKLLEEPIDGIYFLLSTTNKNLLLPTVLSRMTILNLNKLKRDDIADYLSRKGNKTTDINKAIDQSGGNIGLATKLLNLQANEFNVAIESAKLLLTSNTLERLISIDGLVKDKSQLTTVLSALERILIAGFKNSLIKQSNVDVWSRRLEAVEDSISALKSNVSARLVVLRLVLQL